MMYFTNTNKSKQHGVLLVNPRCLQHQMPTCSYKIQNQKVIVTEPPPSGERTNTTLRIVAIMAISMPMR